jgi:hypothetical protein
VAHGGLLRLQTNHNRRTAASKAVCHLAFKKVLAIVARRTKLWWFA